MAGANLSYDAAGNLTTDANGYNYQYDYENRIVKITMDGNDIAQFAYDTLGRRIRKTDSQDANNTRLYYYNNNWQVLYEYTDSNSSCSMFMYGNYIDEVVFSWVGSTLAHYAHDHLYSPVALINHSGGAVLERYEYDAYGHCTFLEPNFTPLQIQESQYANNYLFTGRRLDILDNGSLKIQYNRNRYYNTHTGRFTTHDPLGITPNAQWPNKFEVIYQYNEGMSLYEYMGSLPLNRLDPHGLLTCGVSKFTGTSQGRKEPIKNPDGTVTTGQAWPVPDDLEFHISVVKRDDECGCGKSKLICNYIKWGATYWWSDYSSLQHEKKHVGHWFQAWSRLKYHIGMLPDTCMSEDKAKCYKDAMKKYKATFVKMAEAKDSYLKCRTYPDGIKDKHCNAWENAIAESDRLKREALDKMHECRAIMGCGESCSGGACVIK